MLIVAWIVLPLIAVAAMLWISQILESALDRRPGPVDVGEVPLADELSTSATAYR